MTLRFQGDDRCPPLSASTPQVLETVTNGVENMGGMHV